MTWGKMLWSGRLYNTMLDEVESILPLVLFFLCTYMTVKVTIIYYTVDPMP